MGVSDLPANFPVPTIDEFNRLVQLAGFRLGDAYPGDYSKILRALQWQADIPVRSGVVAHRGFLVPFWIYRRFGLDPFTRSGQSEGWHIEAHHGLMPFGSYVGWPGDDIFQAEHEMRLRVADAVNSMLGEELRKLKQVVDDYLTGAIYPKP